MAPTKTDSPLDQKKNEQQQSESTPGRKLVKEDLATTSVLIFGCSPQTCCRQCPTQVG